MAAEFHIWWLAVSPDWLKISLYGYIPSWLFPSARDLLVFATYFYQISASAKSFKFYECGKVKIVLHNMLVDWHWSLPILIPFVFHREYNQLPKPGHRVNKEVLCVASSPTLFSVNQATMRVTKYGLKYCILYNGQSVNLSTYFSSVIKMCNNV